MEITEGLKNLNEIIERHPRVDPSKNEAQTRYDLINDLISMVLGWPRSQVHVEVSQARKYTDYELGDPRQCIWEAKREGKFFEIPAGKIGKTRVKISTLCAISNDVKDAVDQVQSYCSSRGVKFAVATNGRQIIAFVATRSDGISPLEEDALFFQSLEHLRDNFSLAWQNISYEAIRERRLERFLMDGERSLPPKPSSRLMLYPKVRYPSQEQVALKELAEIFIQDIGDDPSIEKSFYETCYCKSGAISKYSLLSRNILNSRYSRLFSETQEQPSLSPVSDKRGLKITSQVVADSISRRPIVLLGDVGVGKTSFIKNLIYVEAKEEFKNSIFIYINLGSKAALAASLTDFVLMEIERQLLSNYKKDVYEKGFVKGVYAEDIIRFEKGIWGDLKESNGELYQQKMLEHISSLMASKDQHLKRSSEFISSSEKRQFVVILDNADQRDFETQQSAFVISQELAKDWQAAVFIAVRPHTFYRSKRSGALSAYPHRIFTISPPRVDLVVEKRLKFALSMAEGSGYPSVGGDITVDAKNLALFLRALINSLSRNRKLGEFLDNITGGNVRAVIELVSSFIGSPNVQAKKIIEIMEGKKGNSKDSYIVPVHEFSKAALLGNFSHYSHETSIAMNMFEVSEPDRHEHFLVPIILGYMDSDGSHKDRDGFCKISCIVSEAQACGFHAQQIDNALQRLVNKRLIEVSQRITYEEDEAGVLDDQPDSFRITSVGVYHLKRWMGTFAYLEAMLFDTPVFEVSIFDEICKDIESFDIGKRYARAVLFRDYLLDVWKAFPRKPAYMDFLRYVAAEKGSFSKVKEALKVH